MQLVERLAVYDPEAVVLLELLLQEEVVALGDGRCQLLVLIVQLIDHARHDILIHPAHGRDDVLHAVPLHLHLLLRLEDGELKGGYQRPLAPGLVGLEGGVVRHIALLGRGVDTRQQRPDEEDRQHVEHLEVERLIILEELQHI